MVQDASFSGREAANFEPLSPLRFLERSAEVFPDKRAIVYGDRSYTYREFADEANTLGRVFASQITPGDRIAYLLPNVPEMLIGHFAVPLAGGVLVAVNTRLSRTEIEYVLEHSGSRVVVVDAQLMASLGDLTSVSSVERVVVVSDLNIGSSPQPDLSSGQTTGYAQYLGLAAGLDCDPLPWTVADENLPISINYTSGTTGKPKGVVYTHRGAYLNSMGELFHNQFTSSSIYLWTLPMFHCNGWCTPWAVTAAGATHVALRAVRADKIWELIDVEGVTHLCGAPTVCSTIASSPAAHRVDHAIRVTTAGSPPSPTIIEELERMGFFVVHVYGLTEVYGPYTICEYQPDWDGLDADVRSRLLARQGVGMIQAQSVRVVDEAMVDVAADGESLGEIVLRGNNVMQGYYRDAEATRDALRDGWFHTGDLGVMHPDRYIELKDRSKDIVISGGENVSTVEVEQAIVAHESVLEAAVVGRPDQKWGERPTAYVVLRSGEEVTAADLRAHVRARLAAFKVPDDFTFLDELPHTATGKIRKYDLRSAAAKN